MMMLLLASGCVSNPIYATKSGCSELIPDQLVEATENTSAPDRVDRSSFPVGIEGEVEFAEALLNEWIKFGGRQTGQLAKANLKPPAIKGLIQRCEARDREAIEDSKPKFLGLF